MLKILLILNFVISIWNWVIYIFIVGHSHQMFVEKHPDIELPRSVDSYELAIAIARVGLIALCPLLNIFSLFVVLSEYDKISEKAVKTMEDMLGLND